VGAPVLSLLSPHLPVGGWVVFRSCAATTTCTLFSLLPSSLPFFGSASFGLFAYYYYLFFFLQLFSLGLLLNYLPFCRLLCFNLFHTHTRTHFSFSFCVFGVDKKDWRHSRTHRNTHARRKGSLRFILFVVYFTGRSGVYGELAACWQTFVSANLLSTTGWPRGSFAGTGGAQTRPENALCLRLRHWLFLSLARWLALLLRLGRSAGGCV